VTGRGSTSKKFLIPYSSNRNQVFKVGIPRNLTEKIFSMEPLVGLSATVSLLKPELNDATSLKKPVFMPSKGYVIFDRTGDSMRVFCHSMHEPILERPFFNETLASGIAAYENAKATRALSSPLCSLNSDVTHGIISSPKSDEFKNNNLAGSEGSNFSFDKEDAEEFDTDSSYFDEDSEELDALLDLDEDFEEDDEATSSLTFSDPAETGCCSASSNEVLSDFSSENPGKRKRYADVDGEVEEEFLPDVNGQSKAHRIDKRLRAFSSMLGSELRSKEAILDQTIHVVQSLQKYVSTNLQKT